MHVEHPAHPTPAVPTALGRTRFPVQEGRSPCRIPEKSLIILGISFGERSGCDGFIGESMLNLFYGLDTQENYLFGFLTLPRGQPLAKGKLLLSVAVREATMISCLPSKSGSE